jgi:hypothetical protein
MAPPGENLHLRVCEMDLHSIAVEFDLMDPALPVRYFLDLRRQGRRYKAGKGALAPIAAGFLRWTATASAHADRQRKLHVAIAPFVSIGECLQALRHISSLEVAAVAYFLRHILRDILRPTLSGVEAHHANRVVILPQSSP